MSISMIHMHDLKQILDRLAPGELILDVRTPEEFAAGHVPGSRNIPYDALEPHVDELKQFSKIYIYCRVGGRAAVASQTLAHGGLTQLVCITGSGMPEWEDSRFPIER